MVVTGGQYNKERKTFHYEPPIVLSVTPGNGPTIGGTNITIKGSSFGSPLNKTITRDCSVELASAVSTNARIQQCTSVYHTLLVGIRVEIKKKECRIMYHSHDQIICTVPKGVGRNARLKVMELTSKKREDQGVQQQVGTSTFDYDPPAIMSIYPDHWPTFSIEGIRVTLTGQNFVDESSSIDENGLLATVQTKLEYKLFDYHTGQLPDGKGENRSRDTLSTFCLVDT
jgi:hypothetical protein